MLPAPAEASAQDPPRLSFGRFFGRVAAERELAGFRLAQFTPTLPKRDVGMHRHDEAHFVFVLRGVYETSAGSPRDGSPPRIVYSPPGTSHRDCFAEATELSRAAFATLSVSPATLAEVAEETDLPPEGVCVGESAMPLVRQILSEARGEDSLSDHVTEELCLELMQRVGVGRDRIQGGTPAWLMQSRELLRDSAFSFGPRSVKEIAGALGVHPVHFARRFRTAFGQSPSEFLRRFRLERARQMMQRSAAPLAEIADAAGFADQSHFSNAFRRNFGVSPGIFRRRSS